LDPANHIYVQIIVLLFVFSVIVVYPAVLNPAFTILENNIFGKIQTRAQDIKSKIMRSLIVLFTVVVGILSIGGFANLLSLLGCAICTPIALIFPTIFHWKLYKDKQPKWRNILDLSITAFGTLMALTVLVFTLVNWGS
jgi:amino acid permease